MTAGGNNMVRKLDQEIARFKNVDKVHDLPESYNYWRKSFLRPKFQEMGYTGLNDFYQKTIVEVAARNAGQTLIILSAGSGNCEAEVGLAKLIMKAGISDFMIRCIDINDAMLARGRHLAEQEGVGGRFAFELDNLNTLTLDRSSIHIAFANHSLHHVQALEHLFQELHTALKDDGVILVNDMIGRNGHMRWPEALVYVESLWGMIAETKKFHHQRNTVHPSFPNNDCSTSGFEGIRSSDILPLLVEFFSPSVFLGFMNVVQPFISRGYGPNYDPDNAEDRVFLQHVASLDDMLIDRGIVKPTQAIAAFSKMKRGRQRYYRRRSAEFSIRWP